MSHPGFRLVELRLTGKDVEDAEVRFEKGLNVICGPSDTGKTFILQCVNYVFGGKDKPKDIDEAAAYDTILLTIAAYHNEKHYTLKRSLRGGAIEVTPVGEKPFVLKPQHKKDTQDTISYFLLELSRLENKWIKKNADGVTQSLSFRNIVHLSLISEEQVIKEVSPVLTGHRTSKTAELSVFRLLLTGVDDSSIVDKSTDKVSKVRIESKNEILQGLIDKTTEEYEDLKVVGSYEELLDQMGRLEQSYDRTSDALDTAQESVTEMEKLRSTSWERLRQTESRLSVLSELRSRFSILEKQYISDLRRLDSIAETGRRLTEMNLERCSVCGSSSEHHESEHQDALVNPEVVSKSCVAEAVKLRSLLADLKTTQVDLETEIREKRGLKTSLESDLESASKEIQGTLKPQLKRLLNEYRESQEKKDSVKKAIELQDRLREYEGLVEEVAQKEKSEAAASGDNILPSKGIEEFSLEVEKRLKAWNFPNTGRVTFSEADWDIMISGRRRASHGKGVRAITHAAFSLGLLGFCKGKEMPHPYFLMIDSPLVVYREPDPSDASMALDVKDSFYADVASSFSDAQVIILENEDPPAQLVDSEGFNLIAFSKTDEGRYGFIPVPAGKAE
jgi:hypothetical protein